MVEETKGFNEHYTGFKRHWKLAAAVFSIIFFAGAAFTLSLNDVYRSTGFILIEEAEIPEEILRSTVTTYTTRQVTELNERILTIGNLVRIIEEYDLFPEKRASEPAELLALEVRNAISVEIQSRETVTPNGLPRPIAVGFTVSFESENPVTAQAVAEELVNLYLNENIKARAEQTTETSSFLKSEVSRLESEIALLEEGLARFKEENAARLPSLSALNTQQMNRIDAQLLDIQRQLNAIEENRIRIKAQMATVEPTVASRLADGSVVLSPADQLKSLQTQLSVYKSRYSDDFPDVVRTERDIASIKQRFGLDVNLADIESSLRAARTDLAVARQRYSADHPDVVRLQNSVADLEAELNQATQRQLESALVPDNPAYISLQSSLSSLDAEEAALRQARTELQRRMADYEQRLMETPQVEKDLAALTRKLSSTANRYWVMRDKQFAAEMGETLETQSKGESLVLIEPPRVPLQPFKPDRLAIMALTFLFALVCGLASTQFADAFDSSIRGAAAVESVQGEPPLIEIPYIYNQAEVQRARRLRQVGIAAAPVMAIVVAVVVHFTVVRLDVLFFAALQRIGM
ncbi:MAG: hypothetical protein V2J12_08355 [Gammaproteobacteria bacterium]|jgi:uncharacterized protein involved in exopolysaccharide biosynthesis|nr:hypothetical protein [Gammaproteobacteria bacterium]